MKRLMRVSGAKEVCKGACADMLSLFTPMGNRPQSRGEREGGPSASRRSPPPMDTRDPRGVTGALPAPWKGIGYLVEGIGSMKGERILIYSVQRIKRFRRSENEISRERRSLFSSARAEAATTEDNINAVQLMIETDRRGTYHQIRTSLGIGMSRVHKILHEHVVVRKLCTRSIPDNLTEVQKLHRVDWYREMMQRFIDGDSNSVQDIVIGIEILVHSSYSPDIAPCNFYLFPKVKEKLREKWFTDAEQAVVAYEKVVDTTPITSSRQSVLNGHYFEKQQ
ncbi:hypothetical protein EVAR_86592_1 [Eumeta japonica]|uniref:Mariner Mos1 transposase n=1 Tax=Eumeta variegata TaxID=151549 RepID=A0A4C1W3X7_EUMVA|nr:hypothetical protein EVAR_86592_1 [Eumeta japonica]